MRDSVLWRKISRIVLLIAQKAGVPEDQALDLFYSSKTYAMLKNPKFGLQIMSDAYIVDEYSKEAKHSI